MLQQLTDNIWAVKISEYASSIQLYGYANTIDQVGYNIVGHYSKGIKARTERKSIPPGQWEFICTSKEATEEDAKKIVKRESNGYIDYLNPEINSWYGNPGSSLLSLLKSKGIEGNVALLRKL